MSFMNYTPGPPSKSGKTETWFVQTSIGVTLGTVSWYAPWRRYVYAPGDGLGAVYDSECLDEIGTFIRNKTIEHKEKKK